MPQQELGALRKSVSRTSRLISTDSRGLGGVLPEGVTGAGSGAPGPGLRAELGDGVRSGSVAGVGTRRDLGLPEAG